MATSLVSFLIGDSPLKIIDELTGTKRWPSLRTKSVRIMVMAEVTDMPFQGEGFVVAPQSIANLRENIRSGKVINPARIDAEFICDDISVLTSLENVFNDTSHTLKIYSKEIVAVHMAMTNMRIEQTPAVLSAVNLSITFEQTAQDTYDGFNPAKPGDASSYGINVQPKDGIALLPSIIYNKVSNILGNLV